MRWLKLKVFFILLLEDFTDTDFVFPGHTSDNMQNEKALKKSWSMQVFITFVNTMVKDITNILVKSKRI